MESKIHGVSKEDKMKVKPSVFCNKVVEKKGALHIEQIVTTLLGTYLSDEMNFWFTFTSCRYSVSMDTTLTYGKKREIFYTKIKTKHYKALVRFSLTQGISFESFKGKTSKRLEMYLQKK